MEMSFKVISKKVACGCLSDSVAYELTCDSMREKGNKANKTGNNIIKGVFPMRSQVEINNTKYIIERAFNGIKTPAMLIEERVFNDKGKNSQLTQLTETCYSDSSGSVLN